MAERPPIRTGTNWAAVIVGLLSILVAGLIVVREQIDWQIDWQRFGPATLVGVGIVLVIVGSLGLVRRQKQN